MIIASMVNGFVIFVYLRGLDKLSSVIFSFIRIFSQLSFLVMVNYVLLKTIVIHVLREKEQRG